MKKIDSDIPPDKLALYEKLIATNPEIELKGATMRYTSVNGHMFTFIAPDGAVGLRLPKEEREAFLKKYGDCVMIQHGSVMKEYVAIPDRLLKKTAELKRYLDISYAYVKTLKPKPTKRKK